MNIRENRIARHRRNCEGRRSYLAELESLAWRLRADGERLRTEIEQAVAVGNATSAQKLLQRHGQIARSLAAIEAQITVAGDALASAARDLKRQELAAAQRAPAGTSDGRHPPRFPRAGSVVPDRGS